MYLAKQISQSLNLNFSFVQEEILGLQLFISCSAIESKHHFHFKEINFPFVTEIKFPTKPNFLTDWSNEEWHFLLLMVHNSNLSNYIIPLDFNNVHTPELDHDYKLWITLFEKHVAPFDDTQAEFIYQNFIRLYLGSFFFKIDQKLLLSFPGIGFNIKKIINLTFFLKFKSCGTTFLSNVEHGHTIILRRKVFCYVNIYYLRKDFYQKSIFISILIYLIYF